MSTQSSISRAGNSIREAYPVRIGKPPLVTATNAWLPRQLLRAAAVLFTAVVASGCARGTMISVPIDGAPLTADKATVVIYHDQGFTDNFRVFVDRTFLGHVTSETPLKTSLEPGLRELHVEVPVAIDRITSVQLHAGQTYYFRIWLDIGWWVSSIRIDPAAPVDSYEVKSHRQGQQPD